MRKIEIVPGTLVQTTQFEHGRLPMVGVVIKSDVWLKYATERNPEVTEGFKSEYFGFRIFGLVIKESYKEPQILFYSWKNSEGHIKALAAPDPEELERLIYFLSSLYQYSDLKDNLSKILNDIEILIKYLRGDYMIENRNDSAHNIKLLRLFEEGIPRQERINEF